MQGAWGARERFGGGVGWGWQLQRAFHPPGPHQLPITSSQGSLAKHGADPRAVYLRVGLHHDKGPDACVPLV